MLENFYQLLQKKNFSESKKMSTSITNGEGEVLQSIKVFTGDLYGMHIWVFVNDITKSMKMSIALERKDHNYEQVQRLDFIDTWFITETLEAEKELFKILKNGGKDVVINRLRKVDAEIESRAQMEVFTKSLERDIQIIFDKLREENEPKMQVVSDDEYTNGENAEIGGVETVLNNITKEAKQEDNLVAIEAFEGIGDDEENEPTTQN